VINTIGSVTSWSRVFGKKT